MDLNYYKRINGEFYRKVGMVSCDERLAALGLHCHSVLGTFWPEEVSKLKVFCQQNPDYHIVTFLGSGEVTNRYVLGDYRYKLADGDNDPTLHLVFPQEVENHLAAEFHELVRRYKF